LAVDPTVADDILQRFNEDVSNPSRLLSRSTGGENGPLGENQKRIGYGTVQVARVGKQNPTCIRVIRAVTQLLLHVCYEWMAG
jgi:hypothetical protein